MNNYFEDLGNNHGSILVLYNEDGLPEELKKSLDLFGFDYIVNKTSDYPRYEDFNTILMFDIDKDDQTSIDYKIGQFVISTNLVDRIKESISLSSPIGGQILYFYKIRKLPED